MARTVQDVRLANREQRLRLDVRKKPYWMTLNEGEHLGYYRGARVGKWVARYRATGVKLNYQQTTLGEADDSADADGTTILNFKQAQARARQWFAGLERNGGRRAGAYTVSQALDDYMAGFRGRDRSNTSRRIEAIIRPQLGTVAVGKLTTKDLEIWLTKIAAAPARTRTAKGATQNFRVTANTDEARRRRRSSANRIFTILRAALNAGYRNGKVEADDAWRRVKPFAKVDAPKLRYLSEEEARRLVNACELAFRPLVQAALLTGARYAELARLEAGDFDPQSATVWVRQSKASVGRAIYLEGEGVRLFDQATAGKVAGDLIFPRPDGMQWASSQQTRRLAQACVAAKLLPTGFHDLRQTYGARLALQGVPMTVIAVALGHADERITRRHYAHLSKSYVADTVRKAVAGLKIVEDDNVRQLRAYGKLTDG